LHLSVDQSRNPEADSAEVKLTSIYLSMEFI